MRRKIVSSCKLKWSPPQEVKSSSNSIIILHLLLRWCFRVCFDFFSSTNIFLLPLVVLVDIQIKFINKCILYPFRIHFDDFRVNCNVGVYVSGVISSIHNIFTKILSKKCVSHIFFLSVKELWDWWILTTACGWKSFFVHVTEAFHLKIIFFDFIANQIEYIFIYFWSS